MNKNLSALLILTLSIFVLVMFALDPFPDKSHGYFVRIPDMNVARANHKSFLMSDGKVLIVGGDKNNTVEIYDPATNSFTLKKGLGQEINFDNNIILLKNDKLLITGGKRILHKEKDSKTIVFNNAKLYDSINDTLTEIPQMNVLRAEHTSILLKDGRVLLLNGVFKATGKNRYNKTAEVYDPKLNKFILLKSFPVFTGDYSTKMTILENGEVFIVHCFKGFWKIELFNPKTNTFNFSNVNILKDPKIKNVHFDPKLYHLENIVPLKDDRIVLFEDYDWKLNNVATFDLKTNRVKNIGHTSINKRHGANITLLKNNNILITDGAIGIADFRRLVDTAEIFDIKEMKFYKLPKLSLKKCGTSTVLLKDGRVLITGGMYKLKYLKNAIVYKY